MATDSTVIANIALGRIGHDKIDSITDDNKAARQCNLVYANERDALLRLGTWNFAKKNVLLENKTYATTGNLTFADADPDTITDSIATGFITIGGLVAGMRISIADSDNNDKTFTIASLTETIITLISTDKVTAESNTSGITITPRRNIGYDYVFDKPSDFLTTFPIHSKSSNLNLAQNYVVEGELIYANDDEIQLEYIAQITDTTKFPPHFTKVLALQIAAQICMPITKDRNLQKDIIKEYMEILLWAQYSDSKEGQADEKPPDASFAWLSGR